MEEPGLLRHQGGGSRTVQRGVLGSEEGRWKSQGFYAQQRNAQGWFTGGQLKLDI